MSQDVTAAVATGPGRFSFESLTLGSPRPDEVLVRNVATGLCHSDLGFRDAATMPSVLGHEGAGIVEAVGDLVSDVQPGDKVVLSFTSCARCANCLQVKPMYCLRWQELNLSGHRPDGTSTIARPDGTPVFSNFFGQSSFATHSLVTERNIVPIPQETTDGVLALLGPLGCGIQTGAGAVINSIHPHAGDSIAVFGTGGVGLSAIMAASLCGAGTVIAVDVNPDRLAMARELGATHVVDSSTHDVVAAVMAATGAGADAIIETTGIPHVVRTASESLRPGGVLGQIGRQRGQDISFDTFHMMFGRRLQGIIEGDSIPRLFVPRLLRLFEQGRFPFDRLVKFYPFEDIEQAAADMEAGVTVKPVLTFTH